MCHLFAILSHSDSIPCCFNYFFFDTYANITLSESLSRFYNQFKFKIALVQVDIKCYHTRKGVPDRYRYGYHYL